MRMYPNHSLLTLHGILIQKPLLLSGERNAKSCNEVRIQAFVQ